MCQTRARTREGPAQTTGRAKVQRWERAQHLLVTVSRQHTWSTEGEIGSGGKLKLNQNPKTRLQETQVWMGK